MLKTVFVAYFWGILFYFLEFFNESNFFCNNVKVLTVTFDQFKLCWIKIKNIFLTESNIFKDVI